MNVFASLVFVAAVGALPGIVLARTTIGVALSPAVVLTISATGAMLATVLGISAVRVIVALAVVANVAAVAEIYRRRKEQLEVLDPTPSRVAEIGLVAWFSIPSLCLLTLFPPAPLAWDSRSIWWFHASWLQSGGEVFRASISNPDLTFSHPEYPIGNPAAIATLWRLAGHGEDLPLAQALTAVLTALAIACLALVLVHTSRTAATIGAATVLTAAAGHLGHGLAASGYVDVLCASLLVTALAAHVCLSDARLAYVIGSIGVAGASLTKNEGLAFGILVIVIAAIATRHNRLRVVGWGALSLVPALSWSLIVRLNEGEAAGSLGTRSSTSEFWSRLRVAFPEVFRETYLILGPTLVAFVLLAIALVQAGRPGPRGRLAALVPAASLLLAGIVCAIVASFVYAAGEYDLVWWFATSLERVSATPKLFALASLVTMVPVGIELTHQVATRQSADSETMERSFTHARN